MRIDVYEAVQAFQDRMGDSVEGESRRLVERMLRDYRRNGLHLPKDTRDKIQALKEKMSSLGINYQKNLNDENSKMRFTREQLAGTPEDWMESLPKVEGDQLEIGLNYPHVFPILKKCTCAATRKAVENAFNSRCKDSNKEILETLVK